MNRATRESVCWLRRGLAVQNRKERQGHAMQLLQCNCLRVLIETTIGQSHQHVYGSCILRIHCASEIFRIRATSCFANRSPEWKKFACVLRGAAVEIGEVVTASLAGRFVQFGAVECERDAESTLTFKHLRQGLRPNLATGANSR